MGVPKFYRWISERYPLINQLISNTSMLPEIDNFYLDMNGIIHACTHPNDSDTSIQLSLRDMILAIFRYIDRCISGIVKPKKLLFLAIDGVAPRAKLNQQRARRFRAGQERMENMMKARQRGEDVDASGPIFDSNCITPGTEFMEIIDKHLRWYIHKKMKDDPVWRDLEVIYSGHDVPGEGEHKIIQYIRDARARPDYQPNQRHCLYGQDADLIMLGLATHEPHFTLLREVIDFGGKSKGGRGGQRETVMKQTKDARFQLLHLSVLREYIEVEFANQHTGQPLDRERLVDDFIFLTFLVGNDFLPHLPTLDIGESAFDVIFDLYRQLQQESVGYIVSNGEIGDFARLERLFAGIGQREAEILKTREAEQREFNARRRRRRGSVQDLPSVEEEEEEELELQRALEEAIAEAQEEARMNPAVKDNDNTDSNGTSLSPSVPTTPPATPALEGDDEEPETDTSQNKVKDYRSRYYYEKFKLTPGTVHSERFLSQLMEDYLKGLMWCLAYYMKGCISWTWYYPYYYGPMLIDMTDLAAKVPKIHFDLGKPFLPFQQLLGCLPPSSKDLLPVSYQWIMTNPMSPVLEYYPVDFSVDMDGKRNPWEAVVLLPFIDADRLLEAEAAYCPESSLTTKERNRNSVGHLYHYVFDPQCMDTIPSCNPAIGLRDITHCQTSCRRIPPDFTPGQSFTPRLIPGTVKTCAGFPSLGVIPISAVRLEAVKLNVFGSDSRYRNTIISVLQRGGFSVDNLDLKLLLGRSVFVNYPLIHEAKVVGVSCETMTVRARTRRMGSIEETSVEEKKHDDMMRLQWKKEAAQEEVKYLRGRGEPGTGGIEVGKVTIRLRVVPVQGMRTDRRTGARKKVFGETEADVPIQMALWSSPVVDVRFEEQHETVPVEKMYPYGCHVVATEGSFMGCAGKIVGPHGPQQRTRAKPVADAPRVVDVEFTVDPPEPPFGYALNISIRDEYFSSRDTCRRVGLTPSILGMISGALFVDPPRADIGLNLKKNGEYQLLEYVRAVTVSDKDSKSLPELGKIGGRGTNCWGSGDTVQIVGSVDSTSGGGEDSEVFSSPAGYTTWEYSEKAIDLIMAYKQEFPNLFQKLQSLQNQRKYSAKDLFGVSGQEAEAMLDKVQLWIKSQPTHSLPRSPLSTISMSKDAIRAVERAVDVRRSAEGNQAAKIVLRRNVPVETLFRDGIYRPFDAPLDMINGNASPELGDRVINLVSSGVPFGLKGTVIAIHSSSSYVEVLFDEEFAGGKSLQGSCSPFRGGLVAWTSVLKVSRNTLGGKLPVPSGGARAATSNSNKKKKSVAESEQRIPIPVDKDQSVPGTKKSVTAIMRRELQLTTETGSDPVVKAGTTGAVKKKPSNECRPTPVEPPANNPTKSGTEMRSVTAILKKGLKISSSNGTTTAAEVENTSKSQQATAEDVREAEGAAPTDGPTKSESSVHTPPPSIPYSAGDVPSAGAVSLDRTNAPQSAGSQKTSPPPKKVSTTTSLVPSRVIARKNVNSKSMKH
mmetsp:Transcript_20065/g.28834  ORF Transcript_20065/g.28834 Transcript_20065/m.28834 type:complete len:1503 (+) Transcript_20065:75-4583(+)